MVDKEGEEEQAVLVQIWSVVTLIRNNCLWNLTSICSSILGVFSGCPLFQGELYTSCTWSNGDSYIAPPPSSSPVTDILLFVLQHIPCIFTKEWYFPRAYHISGFFSELPLDRTSGMSLCSTRQCWYLDRATQCHAISNPSSVDVLTVMVIWSLTYLLSTFVLHKLNWSSATRIPSFTLWKFPAKFYNFTKMSTQNTTTDAINPD